MGTRHLVGFTHNGVTKANYGQYDGYPSGVGSDVLTFAQSLPKRYGEDKVAIINGLGTEVDALIVVPESGTPTDAERAKLAEFTDARVSSGDDWYAVLRNCQGDLEAILRSGYILDSFNFGFDGIFCEWAYIIDLDTFRLDVYEGSKNSRGELDGLWDDMEKWPESFDGTNRIGVQKIASYPLDELPTHEELVKLEYKD